MADLNMRVLRMGELNEFRDADTGTIMQLSGKECLEKGLRVEMPDKPASRLVIYRKR